MSKVPDNSTVILRCTVGSTVHGTNVAQQDDRDEMAIAIEPMEYVIGLKHWESTVERTQPDGVRSGPDDLDLVTHSLRKYCSLALRGNPTMQIPLFVPESAIIATSVLGRELIRRRDMFLSRQCGKAFLGYMNDQRKRLAGESGGRHGKQRPELVEKYGFDTKYAGHIVRLGLQGLELMTDGHLSLPMKPQDAQLVLDVRTGKWTQDAVLRLAGELQAGLERSLDKGPLPEKPDTEAIDNFLREAYCRAWAILWHRL